MAGYSDTSDDGACLIKMTLPLAQPPEGELPSPSSEVSRQLMGDILVVEDDAEIRQMMTLFLQEEGFSVRTAVNGAQGLDLALESPPGLVLLDMRMPVMNGSEFMRRYREAASILPPVIVLTAAPDSFEAVQGLGVSGQLEKPFDLDDLLAAVKEHLVPPAR
jgi:DNA-binding response OmpR family regulator